MRIPLALLSLLLATPVAASSQYPATAPSVDSGAVVRGWMGDTQVRGRLLQPLGPGVDSVRYCRYPGPPCGRDVQASQLGWLRLGELDHFDRQVGSRWKRGAVIGGLATFLVTYAGASLLAGFCESDCPSGGGVFVGSILVGGAFGAPLGALIGSAFPRMERVY